MKTKMFIKKLVVWFSVLFSASCLLLGAVYGVSKASLEMADRLFPAYEIPGVSVARADEVSDMPLRLWAMNYAYENGIDPIKFDCVIKAESQWNENAYNVNKNGSFDLGIAQWNSQHIKSGYIKLACVADPTCAIKKMIEKVKKDKGFKAWVASSKCN